MRLKLPCALAVLASLSACGTPERGASNAGNETAVLNEAVPVNIAGNATNDIAPTPIVETTPLDRLGRIRVGATLQELERTGLVVAGRDEPLDEESTCTYATFKDRPDVAVMLDGERVVRIDVGGSQNETLGGVRVGQSEDEALRRLGGKAKVEPHPYTGPEGHYLVVHADDAPLGLIVETDGNTVESWRIGQWDDVQLIEGCA